ncbi:LacI family DNA-binding transcriptional regulator [Oceanobacillus damuensis]|uniref:LacI family DNA-binding transcriptional regulator n=1 Tax=Oceanobacillus damuensis TaxID=937928 RepID=UPI00082B5D7F|nr:LacI family DNA-binding transcriptional regulator [Oceanobacillus damuensis]
MVTIKDVAAASGYSKAMVSYALNNKGNLKEETKQKILQAAKELGYVPNSAAAALRSKRKNVVGLILRDISNPTFVQYANYIEKTLAEYGYRLSIFTTYGQKRVNDAIISFCGGGRLDGLIYSVVALDEKTLTSINQYSTNSVVLSVSEVSNVEYGAYIATEHLLGQNHSIVAHIGSPGNHPNSNFMINGYKRALKVHGKAFSPDLIVQGGYDLEDAEKAAEKLIRKWGVPLAIFTASDYAAFGVLNYLRRAKLKLGKDVFLVGWDDIPFAESVGLTTIAIDHEAIARKSVYELLNELEPNIELPSINIPDYELIVRESCHEESGNLLKNGCH